MEKKFTFRKVVPTGQRRIFDKGYHIIKLNGFECGSIDGEPPHKIRLQVVKKDINEDGNPNCSWKWIMLAKESFSVDEAKKHLNGMYVAIQQRYKIRDNG